MFAQLCWVVSINRLSLTANSNKPEFAIFLIKIKKIDFNELENVVKKKDKKASKKLNFTKLFFDIKDALNDNKITLCLFLKDVIRSFSCWAARDKKVSETVAPKLLKIKKIKDKKHKVNKTSSLKTIISKKQLNENINKKQIK